MKKVLFITYFWPPSGKATLHWPLKMVKFLPKFNWQPVVLTTIEDTFSHKDESLLKDIDPALEIIKTKPLDPFTLYRKFLGKEKNEPLIASESISTTNDSLKHKISIWVRMNLFVPDARVGWYFTGVKGGSAIIENEKFDSIISIGPPHSTHLIALRLSKKYKIPHVPVLVDPWVDIIYYKNFKRNKFVLSLDNYFEKSVLKNAKDIIFVTKSTREDFISKYNFIEKKSYVLYWGYNEDDFEKLEVSDSKKNNEEVIVHAGNIFDYQNPSNFWNTVKELNNSGRKIRIKFIGTVSPAIKQAIKKAGLADATKYLGFLPYEKMLEELLNADYLLVCATEKRHLPGKLFEYLRTGKPIIAFGDDNEEVKNILNETNSGMIFKYNESAGEFFEKAKTFNTDPSKIQKYNRKNIAEELSKIL